MTEIRERDSDGRPIVRPAAFASDEDFYFSGEGFKFTADAGTDTVYNHKLLSEKHFNGVQVVLKDHIHGDTAHLRLVDVDNLLGYGAGFVIYELASDWNFSESPCQGQIINSYKAAIIAGLYIQLEYHSTGINDVQVGVNLFLHKHK